MKKAWKFVCQIQVKYHATRQPSYIGKWNILRTLSATCLHSVRTCESSSPLLAKLAVAWRHPSSIDGGISLESDGTICTLPRYDVCQEADESRKRSDDLLSIIASVLFKGDRIQKVVRL